MSDIKPNRLDEVRAMAIYNTEKRFAEAKEKEEEKAKLEVIATKVANSRQPAKTLVEKDK